MNQDFNHYDSESGNNKKLLILQIHFSEFQISEFALYLTMYTDEKNWLGLYL